MKTVQNGVKNTIEDVIIGEKLICPVCNKTFVVSEDTKYIVVGGYTCEWKCFLAKVREPKQDKRQL